ncbi:MAG: molybdopterin molybdotransferase MoeA [Alphaproteobacteria bacterium]|nr:molybdopterin molybdotransferase MoeA [Alphaproteobacteria bacterium]
MTDTLLPLDDALARINALDPIARQETLPLSTNLCGRILTKDCHAAHDVPPFANSAVDGFALADHALTPGSVLPIAQNLTAGSTPEILAADTAAEIFTGAPIPPNTTSIVMREDTIRENAGRLRLLRTPKPGAHIRASGEDFTRGTVIVRRGTRLNSRSIAALAVAGIVRISVSKPLRVGIFSGGDEVRDPGSTLQGGEIHDGNRPGLGSMLQALSVVVTDLGIVPDCDSAMTEFLAKYQQDYDLLLGSAGMSESATDHTAKAMQQQGDLLFWQLAIKPARPVGLARLSHRGGVCYLLGLPGNPASCLLAAWLLGYPLINRLSGGVATLPNSRWVQAGFTLHKKPHRREFIRVRLEDTAQGRIAHKILPGGSATLSSLLAADGVLDVPQGQCTVHQGETVAFYRFPDFL